MFFTKCLKTIGSRVVRRKINRRGTAMVEYALLLSVFAIPFIGAVIQGGAALLQNYTAAKTAILSPSP